MKFGSVILRKVEIIENYFGFPDGVSGSELLNLGRKQARKFGAKIIEGEALNAQMKEDGDFVVETTSEEFEAKGLLIASGVKHEKPNVKGLVDLEGRGVSYCATCDAPLFKDKKMGVLGSQNYAAREALELHNYTQDVTIYTNGRETNMDPELRKALREKEVPINTEKIEKALSDEKFEGFQLESGEEKLDGVFVAIGTGGAKDFARSLGIPIEGDGIVVDENLFTGIPQVYAAGDCIGGARQLSKAVGDGTKAALNLIAELRGQEIID